MREYCAALTIDGMDDERASVVDDLATYFGVAPDEAVSRARNWEASCVDEWRSAGRDSPAGIRDFYLTTQATAFDVLWYAYLQAVGYSYPVSVAVARTLRDRKPGQHHLDFGSGAGVTAQFFQRLGYETSVADVSKSLLDFVRFRFNRRHAPAPTFIDLNASSLPSGAYDVITAIDVLVHVPDLKSTVRMLHAALRPGGVLFANFDVRPMTPENAWHLYSDDLPLRFELQRAGFEPEYSLDGMITRYRRVGPAGLAHTLRGVRDVALLRSPLRPAYRMLKARRPRF